MINGTFADIILLILTPAVAINLYLTFRLATIIRAAPSPSDIPFTVPIGETLPAFTGKMLTENRTVSSQGLHGKPAVLVFLSSVCQDCRRKIPELIEIAPSARTAGVTLLIIPTDAGRGLKHLLQDTPLLELVLILDSKTRGKLNPKGATPFYIFVDHQQIVQASNLIGDEDWQSFLGQMREIQQGAEVPA